MDLNHKDFLSDELLDALMQEEWLEPMEMLKKEYQNIPVPEQAQHAIQQGIRRAKEEVTVQTASAHTTKRKRDGRFYGAMAALTTAAAACILFVVFNTNAQLAVAAAEVPLLKPVVEWMTGQEYHKDVYLNIKVAHLAGQKGAGMQDAMPLSLAALFADDADYITIISDEIKRQMAEDTASAALLDTFAVIDAEQTYYINADGNLVIVLDAYETRPEFEIEVGLLESLLKETE